MPNWINKYCSDCAKYLHHRCEGTPYFGFKPECYLKYNSGDDKNE